MTKKIYVTQPFLPPAEEFVGYIKSIWDSKILTNCGPIHQRFEKALSDYLGVEHVALFANGTLALITALQALRITGEVITTPYSFVATSHALTWNGVKPVFVDIDRTTLNIDPAKIEAAITPLTTAILPVHIYGVPCAVDEIERIADRYGLKVIYDAAHAFGVRMPGGSSLFRHGDISVLSFHATKVFTTFEGGAIVCQDEKCKRRVDDLKNFGFADEVTNVAPGINAKMNEMQAALGLLQLDYIDGALARRAKIFHSYCEALADVPGLRTYPIPEGLKYNFSYFPIFVDDDFPLGRDALYERLREKDIYARRYFYPLISNFPMYRGLPSAAPENLKVANEVAERVLCLPIYPTLGAADQERVIGVVRAAANLA